MNPAHKRHWVDCIRLPSLQQKEEEEEVAPSSTENLLCQEFFLHLLMRTGKQPVVQNEKDKKLSILPPTVITLHASQVLEEEDCSLISSVSD